MIHGPYAYYLSVCLFICLSVYHLCIFLSLKLYVILQYTHRKRKQVFYWQLVCFISNLRQSLCLESSALGNHGVQFKQNVLSSVFINIYNVYI